MASQDTLLSFIADEEDAATAASSTRNSHPVLAFDATSIEQAVFTGIMTSSYSGRGVTVQITSSMTTAVTGLVVWGVSFERIGDEVQDIDSDGFATEKTFYYRTATVGVPETSGWADHVNIVFADGAEIDSIAIGESFRLKIRRVATDANDNATGDAELLSLELMEI